jgi:hypothetical protein
VSPLAPIIIASVDLPALVAIAGPRAQTRFFEFLSQTSATRTRGGLMLARSEIFWPGAPPKAWRRSLMCSHCMSEPMWSC